MAETHTSSEFDWEPHVSDIDLGTYRCTDGSAGILLVVEIERQYVMVMTEAQALCEAGSLETKGIITICPIDAERFPMYLDPANAHMLAAGLRKAADRVASIAPLAIETATPMGRVN